MSNHGNEANEMLIILGGIGLAAGCLFLFMNLGLAVSLWIIGSSLSVAWAVSVIVLLAKILRRMPAPNENKLPLPTHAPQEEAQADKPRQIFSEGLYDVKRDERGRIIAEE